MEIKILRRVLLNRRVDLHAIDATPARWRGDAYFHTVSHGSEPSFAGLQTPNAFVMDLSTSESNGNAKSNFSWKALFAATASQLTP